MSLIAASWALSQPVAGPLDRLALFLLGDWSGHDGPVSVDPERLADACACSMPELADALGRLMSQGLLLEVEGGLALACQPLEPVQVGNGPSGWRIGRLSREAIYQRDNHCCVYCGAGDNLSLDHVIPRSRGGSDDPENLVTACRPCNSSKRDRAPSEWKGRMQ